VKRILAVMTSVLAVAVLVAVLAFAAAPPVTAASGSTGHRVPHGPFSSSAILTRSTTSGPAANVPLQNDNPWGCYARPDSPHFSTHGPADVNAQGWLICNGPGVPPIAGISESLYREDCFLIFCSWTDISDSGVNLPPATWGTRPSPKSIGANALYWCIGNSYHTFQLSEYAFAQAADGTYYSTVIGSPEASFNCD
jgi:hypothetical protein